MKLLLIPYSDVETSTSYYDEVISSAGAASIQIQHDIEGKGKGLTASNKIGEGETVFTERPLVSLQHLDNRNSALVCQLCLRFIGSIERQIGHKLRCLVDGLRAAQNGEGQDDGNEDGREVDLDAALEAGERLEQVYSQVTPEQIAALCSGAAALPMTEDFQLPSPVPCRRGCGALYCGASCEATAWEHHHCLLCPCSAPDTRQTGAAATSDTPVSTAAAAEDPACTGPSTAAGTSQTSASAAQTAAAVGSDAGGNKVQGSGGGGAEAEDLYGIRVDRASVAAFVEHASETNEIFLLAAQVVAATLLRAARHLLPQQQVVAAASPSAQQADAAAAAPCGSDEAASVAALEDKAGGSGVGGSSASAPSSNGERAGGAAGSSSSGNEAHRSALLAAWRPYVHGWKRCWWEAVAVPDDVDDEEEFRGQLRELASDSLELLSAAISDPRFNSDLLQLEVYGSIVGMFELNNLGLTISSPVEDYFLAVDEMEEGADKQAVTKVTQPLLDALDTEYATPCEATAFMALQSCINHSCDPNCTAACDTGDRTVSVMAGRDIEAGEEITLSYIDVTLPYKQRQAELRDYGFVCRCSRCVVEAATARAKRQGGAAAKGIKVGGGGSSSRRR